MIADPEGPSFISRTVTRSCMDQLNARDTRPNPDVTLSLRTNAHIYN